MFQLIEEIFVQKSGKGKRASVGNIRFKATDYPACDYEPEILYMFNLQMMVSTYNINRCVVDFPKESTFTHLNRKCLRCRPFKSH